MDIVDLLQTKTPANNPVLWWKRFLAKENFELWPHQIKMLRDRSSRKTYRCGRRTGKTTTLIIEALWKACVHPNIIVLFFVPFEVQGDIIITYIKELVGRSILTIRRDTYEIVFENGSTLSVITPRLHNFCGDIIDTILLRKMGDGVFVDEIAYIPDEIRKTIFAIGAERSDISACYAGTPRLEEGSSSPSIFSTLHSDSEHHYSRTILPDWNEEREAKIRSFLTEEQYRREILAEF